MTKYNSQLNKTPKKSPKRARMQNWVKLLRVPISISIVPIGTNLEKSPDTSKLIRFDFLGTTFDPTRVY